MNLEKSSFKQRALMLPLLGALWATACGGSTFSGAGGSGAEAGASGAGTGGTGTGVAGAGGAGVCEAACPLVLCKGMTVTRPGECCPSCEPSGGSGGVSGGGAGGCGTVGCPNSVCEPGWTSVYEAGACCPTCVPGSAGAGGAAAGAGGFGGCGVTQCPAIDCAQGYMLQQQAGQCCPSCVPNSACTQGQQGYDALRQQLLAQPGAVACKVDGDCALLSGDAQCGQACGHWSVNAAAAQSLADELSAYASNSCSTCTAVYPPCPGPSGPVCVAGQCSVAVFLGI